MRWMRSRVWARAWHSAKSLRRTSRDTSSSKPWKPFRLWRHRKRNVSRSDLWSVFSEDQRWRKKESETLCFRIWIPMLYSLGQVDISGYKMVLVSRISFFENRMRFDVFLSFPANNAFVSLTIGRYMMRRDSCDTGLYRPLFEPSKITENSEYQSLESNDSNLKSRKRIVEYRGVSQCGHKPRNTLCWAK